MKIPHTVGQDGHWHITKETLRKICPAAFNCRTSQCGEMDDEVFDTIWIMTEKPEPVEDSAEDDGDGGTYYTEWTQTNEPELAEAISEDWDELAVTVGGKQVVILCGTDDDEYGYYWDNKNQEWSSYNY